VKAPRRRADDDVALGLDLEHGEAALNQPVGGEAEQAVDAAEPVRVEDRFAREGRATLAARQHRSQRGGVIAERS